jgi:hypothetical protein
MWAVKFQHLLFDSEFLVVVAVEMRCVTKQHADGEVRRWSGVVETPS